jgi:hypothetical protein
MEEDTMAGIIGDGTIIMAEITLTLEAEEAFTQIEVKDFTEIVILEVEEVTKPIETLIQVEEDQVL